MHNLNFGKKQPKNVGYFCFLKKLPKVNNYRLGENSPNLVTLPNTLHVGKCWNTHDLTNFNVFLSESGYLIQKVVPMAQNVFSLPAYVSRLESKGTPLLCKSLAHVQAC
jgi:hypothetical protein